MAGSLIHLLWLAPAGLLLGWLVNYLSDVLPARRKLSAPVCVHCDANLDWTTYLALRPCPGCGRNRLARAWLLPLLGAGIVVYFWYRPPYYLGFGWGLALLAYFALVTVIDIEHHLVMHPVSLAGAAFGAVMGVARHGVTTTLIGGLAGFGAMLALYLFGRLFARLLARRRGQIIEDDEALGFGDVNLGGIIGLVMGWPGVTGGLFLGVVLGGVFGGLILLANRLTRKDRANVFMPYAPFLVLATVLLLYPAW